MKSGAGLTAGGLTKEKSGDVGSALSRGASYVTYIYRGITFGGHWTAGIQLGTRSTLFL